MSRRHRGRETCVYERNHRELTPAERDTIQTMIQVGSSRRAIARAIRRVSREVLRNADVVEDYDPGLAQSRFARCRSRPGPRSKATQAMQSLVWLVKEGFTAGQIAMMGIDVIERTCDRLIHADRQNGGSLYRHLPRGRRPRRRCYPWRRGPFPDRWDVAERPVEVIA